jgi:hypothetical protein
VASVSHHGAIHLGLDVHRDTISAGILLPDQQIPEVDRIGYNEASVRRLVGRFGEPRMLGACYEAGPTGDELARLLEQMGSAAKRRVDIGPGRRWPSSRLPACSLAVRRCSGCCANGSAGASNHWRRAPPS